MLHLHLSVYFTCESARQSYLKLEGVGKKTAQSDKEWPYTTNVSPGQGLKVVETSWASFQLVQGTAGYIVVGLFSCLHAFSESIVFH